MLGLAAGLGLAAAGAAQASVVYSEDFEDGIGASFTGYGTVGGSSGFSAHGFDDYFWVNNGYGGPGWASTLTLTGLAPHDTVSISFLLAVLDSWDGNNLGGDYFTVRLDGVQIYSETYNSTPAYPQTATKTNQITEGTNIWGNYGLDSAYDMGALPAFQDIAHSGATLVVDFYASGGDWSGGADELWAIDNLSVTLGSVGEVPLPGGLPLLAGALAVMGVALRRARA